MEKIVMIEPKQEHLHAAKNGQLMISPTISQQLVKQDQNTSLLQIQQQLQLLHQERNALHIISKIVSSEE